MLCYINDIIFQHHFNFTHRGQVGNSSIVGISSSLPHPVDNQLGEVEEDGNLEGCSQQVKSHEEDRWSVHDFNRKDDENEEDVSREKETEEDPGGHDMRTGHAATTLLTAAEVTAEDGAGVPAYLFIFVRQCAQETVCHLVQVGCHPRGLDTHKISA